GRPGRAFRATPRTSSGEAYVSEARGALALIGVVDQVRPRPAVCWAICSAWTTSSARMWLAIDALNLRRDGRPKSVHEADDHRALADRGGAAFDGSGTDVADGEDARDGRVEQPGSARLSAGENKAELVAGDSIA